VITINPDAERKWSRTHGVELTKWELLIWILITPFVMLLGWIVLFFSWPFDLVSYFTMLPTLLQALPSGIGALLVGSIVGMGQTLLLRNRVNWASGWFYGTSIGWGLAGLLWWLEYLALGGVRFRVTADYLLLSLLVAGTAGGVAIGLGQWLLLRSRTKVAGWWIGLSAVGWLLGVTIGYAITFTIELGMFQYLVLMILVGLVVGIVTGLGLKWLYI
jgi:hypothetical protein